MSKTLQEELLAAKLKVVELEQEYATQTYFETMPVYDPYYKYCYQTSNMSIPNQLQSVDAWIRAVIKHMGLRKAGHGGGATKAVVVSVPELQTESDIEAWLAHTGKQLRKRVRVKKIVVGARSQ